LQRGINEIPAEAELLYQMAAMESNSARQRDRVADYYRAGGTDPGAALLAIEGAGADRERFLELFFRMGGNGRIDYLNRLAESIPPRQLSEQIGAYTGSRISDRNRDGYYEQKWEYGEGILIRWISDQDQNGIAEVIVDFADGVPSRVELRGGEGTASLSYRYSEYPFLEAATFSSETTRREYSLVPFVLRRPAFESINPETFALQLREDLRAGEDFIRRNAYETVEFAADSPRALRRIHLLEGRIVRVDEWPDSAGTFTRTIIYASAQPVEGIRDLDGDGNPEIREQFRNGQLWKIALDQDGDGVNEFEQIIEGDSRQMYWDYNDDGLYDSRKYASSAGALVREFSTGLDGNFDLSVSGEDSR
jgi:hypothetical protein